MLGLMGKSIRLRLRSNFREPVTSGAGFVGRETELSRLTAMLRHRASATVLVSGHRGVGKTTLVDEAIRRSQDGKALVVRLSLPHVNPTDPKVSHEVRGQILRSLARSLYFTLKDADVDKGLKKRSEELYEKTYLRELQEQGQLATLTEAEAHTRHVDVTETRIEPGQAVKTIVGSAVAGLVAVGGVAVAADVGREHGGLLAILALLLVLGSAVAAAVMLTKRSEDASSTTKRVTGQRTASRSGSFDLSPETLEFELQELLVGLRQKGARAIFVIDELDKLEVAPAPDELESHVIFAILSSLKNFFTLGAGVYVFISGEDFYARLDQSIDEQSYSLAHTLFTDRVFVHVLPYGDVEALIDGLLDVEPDDREAYRQFRNFLCWESRNHVFDLLTLIGDFVAEYDGETPIAHAHESYESEGRWHEGNLPTDWLLAAALQKIVGATFDEAARPGGREERFNQALWLTLLDVAKDLVATGGIEAPTSGYVLTPSRWTSRLQARDHDDLAGAVDRLLARAERYGVLATTEITMTQPAEDGRPAAEIEGIEYAIASNFIYPDSSVGTHAAPSPFEKGFLTVAESLEELHRNLEAAGLTPSEYSDGLDSVQAVAKAVRTRPKRKSPPRSEVREVLRSADTLYPTLLEEGIYDVAGSWAAERGFDATFDLSEATGTTTPNRPTSQAQTSPNLGEFEALGQLILANDVAHVVISSPDRENQILILHAVDPPIAEELHEAYKKDSPGKKGQDRRTQRLPVVQIQRSPPNAPVELPNEIITVVDSNPSKGFVAWMTSWFGETTPNVPRKIKGRLAGWNTFNLDPSGSNIGELRDVLASVSYLADD